MTNKPAPVKSGDVIERANEVGAGDIYYCDTYNCFFRVRRITKKGFVECEDSQDGVKWTKTPHGHYSIRDFLYYYGKTKLHLRPGETPQQAIAAIHADLNKALLDPSFFDDQQKEDTETTALVPVMGKVAYEEAAYRIEIQRKRVEIIKELAEKRINAIKHAASALAKRLHKIMRVIGILETYLGIHEEIFQLTQGAPASIDEPISIRQLILYMDEEAAIVKAYNTRDGIKLGGDINFERIELFDEWLLQGNNLQAIIPEKKGIVALKPSRQKDRYENYEPLTRILMEGQDKMVYLLVRNGENLYRIWTDLTMGDNLFPTLKESADITKIFEDGHEWDRDKAEDAQSLWIRNALLIQGLTDRTEIFQPLPPGRVEFAKPETYDDGGIVRLIRDGEGTLGDGHVGFYEWRKALGDSITRGTRVYFPGIRWDKDGHKGRFHGNYLYNTPPVPQPGIYTVEEIRKGMYGTDAMKILFSPGDTIYSRRNSRWFYEEPHDRKNRVGFDVHRDEVINYDDFTVDDIDYYLKSRAERPHYRQLMPLLLGLRQKRIEELQEERGFITLLSQKHDIPESCLVELVEWWKRKVINKRPLNKDSAKAWRMIIKRAKAQNGGTTK